jgi:hypothetical protein
VGVPDNWTNDGVWSRQAAIAQHKKMSQWTENVRLWGNVERVNAGWERADKYDPPRLVSIHQQRHGLLDEGDNLPASVKPIIDGLKLRSRRQGQSIYGAGLIYDDDPFHYKLESLTQERVPYKVPTSTTIRVTRIRTTIFDKG